MLKLLGKAGADVNGQDQRGESALMIAARRVSLPEIAALIEMGADKRLKNQDGKSAAGFLEMGKQRDNDYAKARALLAGQ
jgi:ankyrin repeat protein